MVEWVGWQWGRWVVNKVFFFFKIFLLLLYLIMIHCVVVESRIVVLHELFFVGTYIVLIIKQNI